MHLYQVLRRPITTEKSNQLKDTLRKYAFEVDMRANKLQIKEAVETAFKVDVLNVNVMRMSRNDDADLRRDYKKETREIASGSIKEACGTKSFWHSYGKTSRWGQSPQ